ncbi:hypothetical protein VTJ49DRAFT_2765 [Mycothermus thermophilus]|uniref:Uncharacterized protein n=1 Tax=Humicola insolens TaxID=85995 RepID=A0ABR3VNS1_HUMIN
MDQSSLFPSAAVAPPPIPRKSAERNRDRAREPDPSSNPRTPRGTSKPKDSSTDDDVFADWAAFTDRDRRPQTRDDDQLGPLPPASPEVISSLITSLSAISRPVSNHFDGPAYLSPASLAPTGLQSPLSLSVPGSPTGGSFGVDYGAYNQPVSLTQLPEEDVPLDRLAASPPVVRTSKPPSGLSPLTAPRSPRSPGGRDSGFKGLISRRSSGGVSRPSSRGSLTSAAESIGKPSIERGSEPLSPRSEGAHALKKQPSLDTWTTKSASRPRGLMYMSSREKLREKEAEKKRASNGAGTSNRLSGASGPTTPRLDPLSADSVIDEEPSSDFALGVGPASPGDTLADPRLIPARDSSLRRTPSNARRSSRRTSRNSKRESDYGAIPEMEEQTSGTRTSRHSDVHRRRHSGQKKTHGLDPLQLTSNLPPDGPASLGKSATNPSTPAVAMFPDDIDDGAPSPAVAQSRRRDREASADYRRRSGRLTPDPFGGYVSEGGGTSLKLKRSSTKLKRLSSTGGALSDSGADHPRSPGARKSSDQPHVAYERPQSADSIDDAVESYLCSPRLSQKIRHPQTGRVISFSEVGDPNGSARAIC